MVRFHRIRVLCSLLLPLILLAGCTGEARIYAPDQMSYFNYGSSGLGWNDEGGDVLVSWAPVSFIISVSDKNGRDLLDPNREGNLFTGATISFQGKTYPAQIPEGDVSRTLTVGVYGWYLVEMDGRYVLLFGLIDGDNDMDEDLVAQWSDGSRDTIHYHCSDHNAKALTVNRVWTLNGTVAVPPFSLVK